MAFLCVVSTSPTTLDNSIVTDPLDCVGGYIVLDPVYFQQNFMVQGLTYAEANQLIGAAALLLSLAFIFRLILKKLGY